MKREFKTENQPNNQQPHLLTADSGSTVVYAIVLCHSRKLTRQTGQN